MRRGAARAWGWLEAHPRRALAIAIAASVLLRAPFLSRSLETDEGGFLMVAQQWHGDGPSLYGNQWVDRPPLILLVFKLAASWGGSPVLVHTFSLVFNVVLVVAAWWAGRIINGARGAVAAAVVASLVGSNVILGSGALTGEGTAGALVLVSCALILQAKYVTRSALPAVLLAFAAGTVASMAFLVKQNFIDAALFAFVLLAVRAHKTWRLMLGYALGVAVPLFVTMVWASSDEGPGLSRLWTALFRFRRHAFDIVAGTDSAAPFQRLRLLVLVFVVSGMVLLSWQLVAACFNDRPRRSLRVACLVMWLYGVLGIAVGASWWRHYLLALVPVLAMGTAIATQRPARRLRTHLAATLAAAASVVSAIVLGVLVYSDDLPGYDEQVISAYLQKAAAPSDGVFIAYGRPSIIWEAGLHAPYRYSWSLPMRGRDPHLTQLVSTLTGPNAPTWLIEYGSFNWWHIDTTAFQEVRATRYHVVATICGHDVYLRDGAVRQLPPAPACVRP
jgi:hypothetical protein